MQSDDTIQIVHQVCFLLACCLHYITNAKMLTLEENDSISIIIFLGVFFSTKMEKRKISMISIRKRSLVIQKSSVCNNSNTAKEMAIYVDHLSRTFTDHNFNRFQIVRDTFRRRNN